MPDFPKLPIINNPPPQTQRFPELPLLEPDPPRMSLREKYGALYYLGIGGLVFSVWLVGSFFVQLYLGRYLYAAIYVLNDPRATTPARYDAAWRVAHDPHAVDAQRMLFALRKDLPDLARSIVAEGLTADVIRDDPKAYAQMVAASDGWPDWLRLELARPMAYAVGEGYRIPWEPLDELRKRSDPALVLWMTYTRAVMGPGDPLTAQALHDAASQPGPEHDLAILLDAAARTPDTADRAHKLDEATVWLHDHHPGLAQVWTGWGVRDGKLAWLGPAAKP